MSDGGNVGSVICAVHNSTGLNIIGAITKFFAREPSFFAAIAQNSRSNVRAQGKFGILPDLSIFAKGLGGGFPVAALGGRADIMSLVSAGKVSMAGTYNANGIAIAAGNAALDELSEPGMYEGLYARCDRLLHGLSQIFAESKLAAHVVGLGPVLQVWFSDAPIHNYRDAARHCDHAMFRKWWEGNLERGILFHPGAYENLFVSFAHSDADIDHTLAVARVVVAEIGG